MTVGRPTATGAGHTPKRLDVEPLLAAHCAAPVPLDERVPGMSGRSRYRGKGLPLSRLRRTRLDS
jgi:hypothetical protein